MNDFKIFPNPANTSINIQLQNEMLGKTNIEITNITGQIVKSILANTDSSLEIPIDDLKTECILLHFLLMKNELPKN